MESKQIPADHERNWTATWDRPLPGGDPVTWMKHASYPRLTWGSKKEASANNIMRRSGAPILEAGGFDAVVMSLAVDLELM